jgi:serine/threonine-protein kinase RsbW
MIEKSKKIRIKGSSDGIHQVEAFIEDICYEYNIFNSYFSNIQLALNEAYFNAREHGNKNDDNADIEISFFSDSKGLHFIIKDQGEGFDYESYKSMNIEDLLEADDNDNGKRGLLVIRMLVDELNFYENGSVIELIFYISSINYNLTLERKKQLELYFKNVVLLKT